MFSITRHAQRVFSDYTRARRMREFNRRMRLTDGMRVLDLGGMPDVWQYVRTRLNITLVNLPEETRPRIPSHHALSFVEGDACSLPDLEDGSFDLVFSNSVIEHVGDEERQAAFAREVRRLGKAYWVQTPSKWFPIEAHTAMPLWWFYPEPVRRYFLGRWRAMAPAWSESMAATRVLSRKRMQSLFPGSQLYVESVAGVPKSYVAYVP